MTDIQEMAKAMCSACGTKGELFVILAMIGWNTKITHNFKQAHITECKRCKKLFVNDRGVLPNDAIIERVKFE